MHSMHFKNPANPMFQDPITVDLMARQHTVVKSVQDDRVKQFANTCGYLEHKNKERAALEISLFRTVYGIDHPKRHVVNYPENWWEAVKERFAPSWFRDRWPVKFVCVGVSLEESYPDIYPVLPEQHSVFKVFVHKSIETPIFWFMEINELDKKWQLAILLDICNKIYIARNISCSGEDIEKELKRIDKLFRDNDNYN